jgi:hypothetical protein
MKVSEIGLKTSITALVGILDLRLPSQIAWRLRAEDG